jgi:hypothetical protein
MKVRGSAGGSASDKPRLLNAAALKDAKKKSITVQIIDVREAPADWNARCVIDIIGFPGFGSMAMNATNTKKMIDETGSDESDNWIGRPVQINLGKATFAGREVDSLQIVNVLAKKKIPKDVKPGEDVPF